MPWTTLRLTVVTPLFSGDDPTSKKIDSPVRVPSIRGTLRFWFRALAAGHGITDLPTLWAQEQAVFGSTSTPSPVALRIRRQPAAILKREPDWAIYPRPTGPGRDQRFRGAQYLLGQGLWNYKEGGVTRPFVAPGQSVELDLRFGDDETVNARFMLALWAWLTYGGLGARTRRGFGQLRCTHVTGDDLPGGWTAQTLTPPDRHDGWVDLGKQPIPEAIRKVGPLGWQASTVPATQHLPAFPTLNHAGWSGTTLGGPWNSLSETLHVAGSDWRLFRAAAPGTMHTPTPSLHSPEWTQVIHGDKTEYPIAALGLPVGYFHRSKADEFSATVNPIIDGTPRRRASPVWLRPAPLTNNEWTIFTFVFRAKLLPPGAGLRVDVHKGRRSGRGAAPQVRDEQAITRAWDAWLDNEDRLPIDFYRGR